MNTAIVALLLGQVANSPMVAPNLDRSPQARYRAAVTSVPEREQRTPLHTTAPPVTSNSIDGAREMAASAGQQAPQAQPHLANTTPDWLVAESGDSQKAPPMDLSKLAFKMFLGTAGVMAAAIASIYLGRQWIEKRRPPEPLGRQVRVLETKTLAPRVSLQLVDAAGQMVLVGVDATGIKGMLRLTGAFEDAWEAAADVVGDNAE